MAGVVNVVVTVSGVTTTINAAGKLEFVFPVTGNAAFFRVQAQEVLYRYHSSGSNQPGTSVVIGAQLKF